MTAQMIKYELVKHSLYKGEPYQRYRLYFKKWIFKWSIIYDLTMFDNWKSYTDNWEEMITTKGEIQLRAIKENKIFD